jgi:serine/threonine protein kinase
MLRTPVIATQSRAMRKRIGILSFIRLSSLFQNLLETVAGCLLGMIVRLARIGSRLGPYEILSAIGAGGMGEVYRARDTRLRREVAVKMLPR